MTDKTAPVSETPPEFQVQLERDNTLVSAGQRIGEWRDLCKKIQRDLLAAREELEQEHEGRRQDGLKWSAHCSDLFDKAERAEAALVEATRDAERYRWLRQIYFSGQVAAHLLGRTDTPEQMDAAIDAAQKASDEPR